MTLCGLLSLFLPAATTSWTHSSGPLTRFGGGGGGEGGGAENKNTIVWPSEWDRGESWFCSASLVFLSCCHALAGRPCWIRVEKRCFFFFTATTVPKKRRKKKKERGCILGESTENILQHIYLKRPQDKQSHRVAVPASSMLRPLNTASLSNMTEVL